MQAREVPIRSFERSGFWEMNVSRIANTFQELKGRGRTALMPYVTVGYPRRDSALDVVPALVEGGADLIELGIPFSDPLADGATIQAAAQQALDNGVTPAGCLAQAAALRARGIEAPLVLMGYYNPILQMGAERFATQAGEAGVDGLIVPDLPPEEAGTLRRALHARGVDLIFLLPPTADGARIEYIAAQSSGFVYLVSLTGVTGARDALPAGLEAFAARVRAATPLPLAVGFGIGTPAQAARVGQMADGVIVGSALVRVLGAADDPPAAGRAFTGALREALDANGQAPTAR